MEFYEKLRSLRHSKNYTQKELAELLYVTRSAVAKWENGLGLPNETSLQKLCEIFAVERTDLLTDAKKEQVIVEKNRTISKQNFLILALIALILIISAGAALLIGHLRHQAPVTVSPAPVITINGKYTYLALDSVSYHEPQIVTRNIKMLPTNEIAKLPGNRKTEHFSICCEEAFDEIRAFYFYLGEDNLYYDATLDNFFEKGESWFTTDIAIPVELNALSFSVPASDYKILIRIELVREEKTFIYFSLYE